MAVTIQLDVDAAGATGKIGAVAKSLKGLEAIANDVDTAFDDIDVGDIGDEIDDLADKLEGFDLGKLGGFRIAEKLDKEMSKVDRKLKKLDNELEVNLKTPSGKDRRKSKSGGTPQGLFNVLNEKAIGAARAKAVADDVDTADDSGGISETEEIEDPVEYPYKDRVDDGDTSPLRTHKRKYSNMELIRAMGKQKSMFDEDFFTKESDDPLGMLPNRLRSLNNLKNVDALSHLTDEDRAASRGKFGIESSSMQGPGGKRARILSKKEYRDILENPFTEDGSFEEDEEPSPLEKTMRKSDRFDETSIEEINESYRRAAEKAGLDTEKLAKERKVNFDSLNEKKRNKILSEAGIDGRDRVTKLDGNYFQKGFSEFSEKHQRAIKEAGRNEHGFVKSIYDKDREDGTDSQRDLTGDGERSYLDFNQEARKNAPENFMEFDPANRHKPDISPDNKNMSFGAMFQRRMGAGLTGDGDDSRLTKGLKRTKKGFNKFNSKVSSALPSMRSLRRVIMAIIPLVITLGVQLLGIAAAMGAVAVAGAAILGGGLLGRGDTMAESMGNAKREVKDLQKALFETFNSTFQTFAPIQEGMFNAIPGALEPVADSMEGLVVYEDTLYELGGSLAGGMEEAVDIIIRNEKAISRLSTEFGSLLGSGALDFFEWLIQSAAANQEFIKQLGSDFIKLIVVLYNVSVALSRIFTAFSPVVTIILILSELLKNDIINALATMAGWIFVLGKAAMTIYKIAAMFHLVYIALDIARLKVELYTGSVWKAYAATAALIGLISGAALVGGLIISSMTPELNEPDVGSGGGAGTGNSGFNGNSGGSTTIEDNRSFTINNNGDDYADQKSTEDTLSKISRRDEAQTPVDGGETPEQSNE